MKVEGESTITQIWEKRGKKDPRCFNYQKEWYIAQTFKKIKVYNYGAEIGHYYTKFHISISKWIKYRGIHQVENYNY